MSTPTTAPAPAHRARGPRETPSRVAQPDIHLLAPALGWYTDAILFAEEWENPELSKRDRSIVTVSALVSRAFAAQLTGHFNRALNNGVRPAEIVEIVTHLAFYAGWPCAMTAFGVMQQVFAGRQVGPEQIRQSISDGLPQYAEEPIAPNRAHEAAGPIAASALAAYEAAILRDDLWQRPELSRRDRSLATITCLIVNDEQEALIEAVRLGIQHGLTATEISRTLTHLAFYLGFPKMKRISAVLERHFPA
jgi:4-carboxymuconolactone decarboxylase